MTALFRHRNRAVWALAAVLGLTAAGAWAQLPPIIRMTFNNDAGSPSATNRGLAHCTGTLYGGATYSTDLPPGRTTGRSIELLGGNNDGVSIGSRTELSNLKSFTVTTWIKPKGFNPEKTWPRIIHVTDSWVLQLNNTGDANTNRVAIYFWNSTTSHSNHRFAFGEWKFLAVTFDGTTNANNLKFYVGDGTNLTLDAVHSVTQTIGGATATYIGYNGLTNRNLNGLIDDLRVYGGYDDASGVLSSQQIAQIMQQMDYGVENYSWVPSGDLYVAHGPDNNSRVRHYALSGGTATFVKDLATGIKFARGMARALDGNLVVADRDNSMLVKGTNGLAPGSFPVFGSATGITKPRGVAVRPNSGQVYTAVFEGGYVRWYTTNGVFVGDITGLTNPHGLCFNGENELYVVGGPSPTLTGGWVRRYDWNGSAWVQTWQRINLWQGVDVRVVKGRVYVATMYQGYGRSKIVCLNREDGSLLGSWFGGPLEVAMLETDPYNNLYLTDFNNNRLLIHKLDANGMLSDFRVLAVGTEANPIGCVTVIPPPPKGTVILIR